MKVILLEDVYKHGVAGQVVTVADGFARNYLIPKRMAVKATRGELKRTEQLRHQVEARRAAYENKLNELAREIDGTELIFGRRAAVTGKLFGSVTTQEMADALLEATGVDINRRRISQQSLREIGTHEVPVRLGTENPPMLKITIVRDEELAEFLAARERGEDIKPEDTLEGAPGEIPAVSEEVDEVEAAAEPVEEAEISEEPVEEAGDLKTEVIPEAAVQEAIEKAEEAAQAAAGEEDAEAAPDAEDD